jgi:hypothetical protein
MDAGKFEANCISSVQNVKLESMYEWQNDIQVPIVLYDFKAIQMSTTELNFFKIINELN